ncbi:unnamed protein product [Rotaria sp. Silwood2]|nr:unnamed protein product [Rotaria sp. Silwood2]
MPTDDIHILSSSDSRILISLNVTDPSSSSNSSSIELTSCSIERIYYLLKTEKQQCSIIKNKISPPAVFFGLYLVFQLNFKKKLVGEKNAMKTKLVDAPPAAQRWIKTIVE